MRCLMYVRHTAIQYKTNLCEVGLIFSISQAKLDQLSLFTDSHPIQKTKRLLSSKSLPWALEAQFVAQRGIGG